MIHCLPKINSDVDFGNSKHCKQMACLAYDVPQILPPDFAARGNVFNITFSSIYSNKLGMTNGSFLKR